MDWFRTWLLGVISASLILAVLDGLIPKGAVRSIAHFTGGLILILVVLRPILQIDPGEWKLPYSDYEAQIEEQLAVYEENRLDELRTIIEAESAAYISDKGMTIGVTCHPKVTTQLRDNLPYPYEVTLDTAWNTALSDYITQELGIPPDHQYWSGSN